MSAPYPWQTDQWQLLCKQVDGGVLPHALLLRGLAGLGKQEFAKAFAARLLCASPGPAGACGQCKYCQLLAAGTHPDVSFVGPEDGSKTIKIDQIRDINALVARQAQFEGYRVVVIAPAEAMNANAANAMLKSLEEPGSRVVFMLVTDAPHQLLPTIRSRCRVVDFAVPSAGVALPWLVAQGVKDAEALCTMAGGAPLSALALADPAVRKRRDDALAAWNAWMKGQQSPVELSDHLVKLGVNDSLLWLAGWYADLARLMADETSPIRNETSRPTLSELVRTMSPGTIFGTYDRILSLRSAFLRGANINPAMALESLFIELRAGHLRGLAG